MIVFDAPERYRGTIEVYAEQYFDADDSPVTDVKWRWRCKSRNGQILASGEGYRRKGGALNAIDAQYSTRLTDAAAAMFMPDRDAVPWRLVVRDRHGDITTTGAVY